MALAGCGRGGDHSAFSSATDVSAQIAPTPLTIDNYQASDDQGRDEHYEFHIRYPQLQPEWEPLARALHDFGDQQKRSFLDAVPDSGVVTASASFPWQMNVNFELVAQTDQLVSILAQGNADTGGAHGNPILASFTYHIPTRRMLALGDLFANPGAGLEALAVQSRRQLLERFENEAATVSADAKERDQWIGMVERRIADGTRPTPDNFDLWVLVADDGKITGLTMIFPPYQVASYADGTQRANIEADAFGTLLKPEMRGAFGL